MTVNRVTSTGRGSLIGTKEIKEIVGSVRRSRLGSRFGTVDV